MEGNYKVSVQRKYSLFFSKEEVEQRVCQEKCMVEGVVGKAM